jgi:hypothetical protein
MLRECRVNEWQVRVDKPRSRRLLGDGQAALRKHALDRVVVSSELGRDRPYRPVLGMVEAEDRRALVRRDRAVAPDHDHTSGRSGVRRKPRTTTTALGTALARPHAAGKYTPAARASDNADGRVDSWNG